MNAGWAGFPTFKKRHHLAFHFVSEVKAPEEDGYFHKVRVPKVGWVQLRCNRMPEGRILNTTFSHHAGHWYISFCTEQEIADPIHPNADRVVGINRGMRTFTALSNGEWFSMDEAQNRISAIDKKLVSLQRKAARQWQTNGKQKSGRWRDTQLRIARLKKKQADIRLHFLHNLSNRLTQEFGQIAIEDFDIKKMSAHDGEWKQDFNREMLSQGWFEFARQLEYKLTWRGGTALHVSAVNITKECSQCGALNDAPAKIEVNAPSLNRWGMIREDRIYKCGTCHNTLDMDVNAAINVLKRAVDSGRKPPSTHAEGASALVEA